VKPTQEIQVKVTNPVDGSSRSIGLIVRLDTPVEIDYYRNGGILPAVLRKLAAS
jgi:aconitate hydratase